MALVRIHAHCTGMRSGEGRGRNPSKRTAVHDRTAAGDFRARKIASHQVIAGHPYPTPAVLALCLNDILISEAGESYTTTSYHEAIMSTRHLTKSGVESVRSILRLQNAGTCSTLASKGLETPGKLRALGFPSLSCSSSKMRGWLSSMSATNSRSFWQSIGFGAPKSLSQTFVVSDAWM